MQFSRLQITASVLFVYFFIKAYVVSIHLNCKRDPQHMQKKKKKNNKKKPHKTLHKHNLISSSLIVFLNVPLVWVDTYIGVYSFCLFCNNVVCLCLCVSVCKLFFSGQRFLKNYCTLDFEIWYKHWV